MISLFNEYDVPTDVGEEVQTTIRAALSEYINFLHDAGLDSHHINSIISDEVGILCVENRLRRSISERKKKRAGK